MCASTECAYEKFSHLKVFKEAEMENLIWLVPVIAVIALAYAIVLTQVIKKKEIGTDRMKEISGAIKEGAQAF